MKNIIISYSIVSQNCLKSIVRGTKSFSDDKLCLRFVKRLNAVKNALCERADSEGFTRIMKQAKKTAAYQRKFPTYGQRTEGGNNIAYSLSYSCKTTH